MADRVVVMYAGRAVEEGGVREIFARPVMPYTQGLIGSIPRLDRLGRARRRLKAIPGNVPNPLLLPPGCAFQPRCTHAAAVCGEAVPPLEDAAAGHRVRCARWREISAGAGA
jgi:oligopeptide/dipeptide ABC transporter ATP-binding protein